MKSFRQSDLLKKTTTTNRYRPEIRSFGKRSQIKHLKKSNSDVLFPWKRLACKQPKQIHIKWIIRFVFSFLIRCILFLLLFQSIFIQKTENE